MICPPKFVTILLGSTSKVRGDVIRTSISITDGSCIA